MEDEGEREGRGGGGGNVAYTWITFGRGEKLSRGQLSPLPNASMSNADTLTHTHTTLFFIVVL